MRIVVVLAILSVVFALESEFLFKYKAEEDSNIFRAPNLAESFLQQGKPEKFAWWTGFENNENQLDVNTRGRWVRDVFVAKDYHGCGFSILYDISGWQQDNSGIKEIYLIACNPNAPDSEKRLYYLLTDYDFRNSPINRYKEEAKDLICDKDSSLIEYNIRYQPFKDETDNEGMTGIRIRCTQGENKEYFQDLGFWPGHWMQQSRSWPGNYFVCGAKAKYLNWNQTYKDESRVGLLDLGICTW